MGCLLTDLGLVNALGGAIFGALITLIFPGVLLLGASKMGKKGWPSGERTMMIFVIVLGVILLMFGSTIVLLKKYKPSVLR